MKTGLKLFGWPGAGGTLKGVRLLPLLFGLLEARAFALGGESYVEAQASPGSLVIRAGDTMAALAVDTNDFPGVIRAVNDLRGDLAQVTGHVPPFWHQTENRTNLVLVGTLGHSGMIDGLVRAGKVDVSAIAGKWEASVAEVVEQPWPGVARALVICGSDKRGTIYGVYDLSEQLGVSPWHYFADVPAPHWDAVYVKAGQWVQGPPVVKYRGIFLNDEAPDLTGWAQEKFGGYNHGFYTNVFELLLRLKANYLWPAMWNNCFNEDDPENYRLADEYGIVMGTSHVEPMMRADKEWNCQGGTPRDWNFATHSNALCAFWRDGVARNRACENIITIGMRGKIDTPMSETANIALLEAIVAAERRIISEVYQTNAAAVPQLWALYKEVQEYYEKGMRVPDDVTLLWSDDNWGDLRRLPAPEDRARPGGSGIYYHLDYVGSPRNYKWVNTTALPRIWEQMQLAHAYGADRIWIVNVGHLQHVQFPTEFFLTLAWNPDRWPRNGVAEFTRRWAAREFGAECAESIADLVTRLNQLTARRKPELLAPETYSVVNYGEGDRVLADWQRLVREAEGLAGKLPPERRDAFYELVLHPVKAGANLNELYVAAAKNHLYAAQGRASANQHAAEVERCFIEDARLSDYYHHQLAGGKWNHMMDQTHIGYTSWQQPDDNLPPPVVRLDPPGNGQMGVAILGDTHAWPGSTNLPVLTLSRFVDGGSAGIEVFNRGQAPFEFYLTDGAPWLKPDTVRGRVQQEKRIDVTADWDRVPPGETKDRLTLHSGTNEVSVSVRVINPPPPPPAFKGLVEADGCVSVEAAHYTAKKDAPTAHWEVIDHLGNTLSGMTVFPMTAPSVTPPEHSPCLEYTMYLFKAGRIEVESRLAPTLNFLAGHGLRFGLSFDDQPPQIITAVPEHYTPGDANEEWQGVVSDHLRKVRTAFELAQPGEHTLKFWMVDPGVVLEKIIVDGGGVKPSYLGPPESPRR